LLKADQDFITTYDPEHVARKRAWLYNMEFPTDPDEQAAFIEEYGDYGGTIGQANVSPIYPMREIRYDWQTPMKDYDAEPTYDEGRTLLNLPEIYDNVAHRTRKKHRENMRGGDEDWGLLDPRSRAYRRMFKDNEGKWIIDDDDIIDEIIRVTNHEVGHTTQPAEEEAWKKQHTAYRAPNRLHGLGEWDGFWRDILMQESLASLMEDPHNTDWQRRVAEYSALGLNDHHDKMRAFSHGLNQFFINNPEAYRSPEKVAAHNKWLEEFLAEYDAREENQ
jgi:hypothetical protein